MPLTLTEAYKFFVTQAGKERKL